MQTAVARIEINQPSAEVLLLSLAGAWHLHMPRPDATELINTLKQQPALNTIRFDTHLLESWDTGLLIYLHKLSGYAKAQQIRLDEAGLPAGVRSLFDLAAAVPAQTTRRRKQSRGMLQQIGEFALSLYHGAPAMLRFLGELTLSFGRLLRGKAQYRASDFFLILQEVGPQALPIVSLISFLVGLILAYMGALQLAQFGAQVYIADLVGIGMVREIGGLMTGIIMAGRTGAAFAAQLGTMQVNEEIDAYRTLGISPIDFLVLPRVLALVLMIPLLTLYAGFVGILAGMIVSQLVFDIGIFEYYHQTIRALDMQQFVVGLIKGTTYGALIGFAGCLRGMQCGRSAQAVGQATTSAVVTGILFIVIAASLLTIIFQRLGI